MTRSLVRLGRLVMTRGVAEAVDIEDVLVAIARHARGDWGDVEPDDAAANEEALRTDARLFSVYTDSRWNRFYVVTEADRAATTALLPDEY